MMEPFLDCAIDNYNFALELRRVAHKREFSILSQLNVPILAIFIDLKLSELSSCIICRCSASRCGYYCDLAFYQQIIRTMTEHCKWVSDCRLQSVVGLLTKVKQEDCRLG